jgi:sporulation protein YabP
MTCINCRGGVRDRLGGCLVAAVDEHDITIKGRKSIEITGVSSVESFDVNEFHLKTVTGPLKIQGSNLHMKHLNLEAGVVVIEGTLNGMSYTAETSKKKRLSGRLLR